MRRIWPVVRESFDHWLAHSTPQTAAGLAYYTVFSLAPLLLIAIGIAGVVLGQQEARAQIVQQATSLVGSSGRAAVEGMLGDVRAGAVFTAALFTAGRLGLGWYLGREGGDSAYAAAASLLALLAWVYYSSQLVLFGAEFTYTYALRYGSRIGQARAEPSMARQTRS
jgi:uncharacterized BrkB/YihY/UPF0761 family membrane protein